MVRVAVNELSAEIRSQLNLYNQNIAEGVKKKTRSSMRKLVKETKAQPYKKDRGAYKAAIASRKVKENKHFLEMQWYVKAPHYRLTHLLEDGHAMKDGGRFEGYGTIRKALDHIVPEFEQDVEEVIRNG